MLLNNLSKFIFIFFLGLASYFPQQPNLRFDHLTVDDGLSQITANTIYQDRYGFIWIGTQDGLNRYDGYNFKIFTHEPGNKNSLSNNYIWSVYEDNDGIMWIGSFGGGLTRFDPATESFTHFKQDNKNKNNLSSNDIFGIFEYPEGTLWLRTGNGINKFDKKTGKTVSFLNGYISALTIQAPGFVWANIDSRLVRLDINSGEIKYFSSYPENSKLRFGNIYNLIFYNNNLFVCCDAGLIKIDFISNSALRIPVPNIIENKNIFFNHLLIDGDYYLIGTNNGLILYDKNQESYFHYLHNPDNPNSLTHNNIVSMFKSLDGIIWVGSYGGINKINKMKEDFILVEYNPTGKNSLSQKSIGPIIEDKKGIVWIGTPNGLNAYNRLTNENTIFKNIPGNPNSLSSNYILFLYEDKKGNIWAGTRGSGVVNKFSYENIADIKDIAFERIKAFDPKLSSNRVQSILEDSEGYIWMGTGGSGLVRLSPKNGNLKAYPPSTDGTGPSHTYTYCIYEDSKNNFWIGTPTGGLNLFDKVREEFLYIKHDDDIPNSLSNDIVLTIFEDSKNQLWIGTSAGLNKMNTPIEKNMFDKLKDSLLTLSFTKYGREHGLPNEVVYGILEDDIGFHWFSTNRGLVKFDPLSGKAVKVFDVKDGLQNNEFNQNAFFKNKEGEMYFGGIGGLNIFHPDSVKVNKYIPPVYFTDFKLFNESVQIKNQTSDDDFSLDKSIYMMENINLSYNQNVMTFEFSALNYIIPQKNQYAYMMEGFDQNWITAGNRRSVTYTNLDPGEYTFRVKASNNDAVWNEQGAAINISISPPPWLSWYAYLIYAAIFIGILLAYIRFRVREATKEIETQAKIERAKIEEREEVRKKSSADFHDEAGNKLTKISLFTELARTEAENNPSLTEYLNKIEENTKEISSGMRDFIWVLDPAKDSLYDMINRLKDFGSSMFDYSDIRFNVSGLTPEMKNIILPMETRRALMLIYKEAMNNCLKYSDANCVEMTISSEGNILELILKDDGKGFDLKEKSNGYGLNNMRERAKKINYSIEISSKVNGGTKITLKGNIPHMGN